VVKPGGIIYLDHEVNEGYWNPSPPYQELSRLTAAQRSWTRFLKPASYYVKFRRAFNPRFNEEGDIHVFPDDHVDWKEIRWMLSARGFETVLSEDYLLCRRGYSTEVFEKFKNQCSDMHLLVAQKRTLA
jgi:hypothetical protein